MRVEVDEQDMIEALRDGGYTVTEDDDKPKSAGDMAKFFEYLELNRCPFGLLEALRDWHRNPVAYDLARVVGAPA